MSHKPIYIPSVVPLPMLDPAVASYVMSQPIMQLKSLSLTACGMTHGGRGSQKNTGPNTKNDENMENNDSELLDDVLNQKSRLTESLRESEAKRLALEQELAKEKRERQFWQGHVFSIARYDRHEMRYTLTLSPILFFSLSKEMQTKIWLDMVTRATHELATSFFPKANDPEFCKSCHPTPNPE